MKRYIIEREIPGIGTLDRAHLKAGAKTSNDALRQIGPDIQWIDSFVAENKTFCYYLAKDEEVIKRHAELSGFPATKITEIGRKIDPMTEYD